MKFETILKKIPVNTLILITLLVLLVIYISINYFFAIPDLKKELKDKRESFQDLAPCHSFYNEESCPSRCSFDDDNYFCYDDTTPCNKFWGDTCPVGDDTNPGRCELVATDQWSSVCKEKDEELPCKVFYDSATCPSDRCTFDSKLKWDKKCHSNNYTPVCNDYGMEDNCPVGDTANPGACEWDNNLKWDKKCYTRGNEPSCNDYQNEDSCPIGDTANPGRCRWNNDLRWGKKCIDPNVELKCSDYENSDSCPSTTCDWSEFNYACYDKTPKECSEIDNDDDCYRENPNCASEWTHNSFSYCRDKYCNDFYNENECPGANGQTGNCEWKVEEITDSYGSYTSEYCTHKEDATTTTQASTTTTTTTQPSDTTTTTTGATGDTTTTTLPPSDTTTTTTLAPGDTTTTTTQSSNNQSSNNQSSNNQSSNNQSSNNQSSNNQSSNNQSSTVTNVPVVTAATRTLPDGTVVSTNNPAAVSTVPIPSNAGTTSQGLVSNNTGGLIGGTQPGQYISSMPMPIPSTPLYGVKTGNYKGLGNIFLPMMKINEGNRKDIYTRININNNPIFSEEQ